MKKIILAIMITTGVFGADTYDVYFTKLIKTNSGFKVNKVSTYFTGNIIWGDGWCDHDESTAFKNSVVVAFGDNWSYSAITNDDGVFKVEVKGNSEFTIKASSGSEWHEFNGTIEPVEIGTTYIEVLK